MYKFTLRVFDETGDNGSFIIVMNNDDINSALGKAEALLNEYTENETNLILDKVLKIEQLD